MLGSPAVNFITTVAGKTFLMQSVYLMFLSIPAFEGIFTGAVLKALTYILAVVPNVPSFSASLQLLVFPL
jgi:hypothetical protein